MPLCKEGKEILKAKGIMCEMLWGRREHGDRKAGE